MDQFSKIIFILPFIMLFVACDNGFDDVDTTPPTVSSTYPTTGATKVTVGSTLSAFFSEAMNAATITTSSFTLVDTDTNTVNGAVNYSSASNTVTFKPATQLANSTNYTATITTSVTDVAGNALAANYSWNFTTAAGDSSLELKKARIQSFLDKQIVPLIDMESTLSQAKKDNEFPAALTTMDDLGIAQIAFEGAQAPKQNPPVSGYRWSTHVQDLNNEYPAYFFVVANGGNNNNWAQQKDNEISYIFQLENAINSGSYQLMGEMEFKHYLSTPSCYIGDASRLVSIDINSSNGQRVFDLSEKTGVPFVIHYEPEDTLIAPLKMMLDKYTNAKVIWAHLGQIRKPNLMQNYSVQLIAQLLDDHPNLYVDISTGEPNRRYHCVNDIFDNDIGILDTVLWVEDSDGYQTNTLKQEYHDLLENYKDRFVVGFDYGGDRPDFAQFMQFRVDNVRLIMDGLSDEAKHAIGYKNAWRLLTGTNWQ